MAEFTLPRPTSGDIVTLILDDHRVMEGLLRDLRIGAVDRGATRATLAAALVAHGEAEERAAYGRFATAAEDVSQEEVEHGHQEHAEGHAALLELMECKGLDTQKFQDALEKLTAYLSHHVAEEELTILGPALKQVPEEKRRDIGAAWLAARSELLDADCGRIDHVRELVEQARAEGVVPDELPDQPQE